MESAADLTSEPPPPSEKAALTSTVEEPAHSSVRPPAIRQPSNAAGNRPEVVVAEVERALVELLRRYKGALKFAADMPFFARCQVAAEPSDIDLVAAEALGAKLPSVLFPWRLAARFYTRLYVETHVRRHLLTILSQLRLELLGMTASEDRDHVKALESDLAGQVEPLLGWRRIAGVITGLPPVAAVLPVLFAAAAHSVGGKFSGPALWHTVFVLLTTTVVVWVLVVWPSIRLGFRIKRAIFCGGHDIRHPFFNKIEMLEWKGYVTAEADDHPNQLWVNPFRKRAGRKHQTTLHTFPEKNVYEAENALYTALDRRKPSEVPIDMLLSLAPYLLFAVSALLIFGVVQELASGGETASFWFMSLPLSALIVVVIFQVVVLQTRRNYRSRCH